MAAAHAKFTGEIGVCLATGGPGATHLLTGLYDAKLDHMPVLAISGQAEATVRGGSYQQELNLDRMFADVADFVQEVDTPAQVRHLIDRAVRIAIARNGARSSSSRRNSEGSIRGARVAHGFTRSGPGYSRPMIVPTKPICAAADVLNAGEGGDTDRRGRGERSRGGCRGRRSARRRRRQGAARKDGAA